MANSEIKMVKIVDIRVGERKRKVEKIEALKNSIQKLGLIQPITVNSKLELIAGNHRLEAFKALGKTEIPVIITNVNEVQAELMEIDENLIRKSLSKMERDEQILRRKELYEQLHPEATKEAIVKKNLAKRKDSVLEDEDTKPVKTFVEDTAEQTGMSKRSIQQSIQNAKNITSEVREKIKGTPLENKTTAITNIAKAKPEKQLEVVEEELEKLNKPKKKPENKTEKQDEMAVEIDKQISKKELDIAYKVDFVLRKVVVDDKWLPLPPEYDMYKNSYENMILVAKNYANNLTKEAKQ